MEQPYPYRPANRPVERTSIYFSTDEVPAFHTTQMELNQTICLWGPTLLLHGNIVGVQLQLMMRYGSSLHDYPFFPWDFNVYLIRLPAVLNRDFVITDLLPWCSKYELLISPWDPSLCLMRQSTFAYRLDIIVTGFPVPLWHEFFIIRFLSCLGEVIFVNDLNLAGHDKTCIMATIRDIDPRAVPRFVVVHFLQYWKECRIHIREWDDLPYIPPHIRPYPDFTILEMPYGDNMEAVNPSSPIRAHAICCHDVLREACSIPVGSPSNLTLTTMEERKVQLDQPMSPHSQVGITRTGHEPNFIDMYLGLAVLYLVCANRPWPKPPSPPNPNPSLGKETSACMQTRGSTPLTQPTKNIFKTNYSATHALFLPTKPLEALHALQVDSIVKQATKKVKHSPCKQSLALDTVLSQSKIPFAPQHSYRQVASPSPTVRKKRQKRFDKPLISHATNCVNSQIKNVGIRQEKGGHNKSNLSLKPLYKPNVNSHSTSQHISHSNRGFSNKTTAHSLLGPYPNHSIFNSKTKKNMQGEEEIAALFASIAPEASLLAPRVALPTQITASRDWSLSCLARVITDRVVFDENFITHMMSLWNAYPTTRISSIARNTYLIDFTTSKEMYDILNKESWFYRTDIVSLRKVHEPSQLKSDFITQAALWTQFHNVPPELLSAEGIIYLAHMVGVPLLEVKQGYNACRLFMKVKVSYDINKGLKDILVLDHPILGDIPIYLVYKRAARLCSYCGFLGHDLAGCSKRGRVLQLCADPFYAGRTDLARLRDYRNGVWMNCAALVPRPLSDDENQDQNIPPASTNRNPTRNQPSSDPAASIHTTNLPFPLQAPVQLPGLATATNPTAQYLYTSVPVGPGIRQLGDENSALLPNQDQASPLYPSDSAHNHHIASNLPSSSNSLPICTRHLALTEIEPRHGSISPPPGFHKRLRAASPILPPRFQ